MALWNDLSRRVADTKDKTVQQAKVLTETQKLNALIAEEKKKIEACYRELGMQYAQLHHDDYEGAFAGVMGTILAAEKTIQDSQAKIRDIKGIRCCEKCGAELTKDAAFCSGCGAVIPKPVVPAGRFCTGCGAPLAEGMRFCTACGTPAQEPAAPVTPAAPAAESYFAPAPAAESYFAPAPAADDFFAQPPVQEEYITQVPVVENSYAPNVPVSQFEESYFADFPVSEVPRCPQCNAVLEKGMAFCTNCGCRMV